MTRIQNASKFRTYDGVIIPLVRFYYTKTDMFQAYNTEIDT